MSVLRNEKLDESGAVTISVMAKRAKGTACSLSSQLSPCQARATEHLHRVQRALLHQILAMPRFARSRPKRLTSARQAEFERPFDARSRRARRKTPPLHLPNDAPFD